MSDDSAAPPPDDQPPPRSAIGYPGRYADGKTAAIHETWLQFGGDGVRIMDAAGQELALWPYDGCGQGGTPGDVEPGHGAKVLPDQ